MPVVNLTRGSWVASRVRRADRFSTRLIGWLRRKHLMAEESLWLIPCKAVHTLGMRIAIDVVFLDKRLRVVALFPSLHRNRISPIHFGAHSVLELPEGMIRKSRTRVGDQFEVTLEETVSVADLSAEELVQEANRRGKEAR